jgi:1,4-dihydroxy-6-naphthoate synthase
MTLIRIGHSPDPDDAFMFYALTAGKVKAPGIEIEHVLEDIETLNRRARTGELDVTAVSAATYVLVHEQYRMMDPGASMGKGYGPILVAKEPMDPKSIVDKVVAIPGKHTTAALLLRIFVGDPPIIEVAFDKIPQVVLEGQADLGLLIHEGQITHRQMGLHKVLDLGEVWEKDSGLPLPLGINVMRRDLGEDVHRRLSQALRDSIDYAYAHVDEALDTRCATAGGSTRRPAAASCSCTSTTTRSASGPTARPPFAASISSPWTRTSFPRYPPSTRSDWQRGPRNGPRSPPVRGPSPPVRAS